MATMASTAIQTALVENSVIDTQSASVLPPPEPLSAPRGAASAPSGVRVPTRTPWWSISLLTVAAQIVLFVAIASLWPIERYETAPGTAQEVAPRIQITDAEVFEPESSPYFVTATSSELTGLQALMGWFDPTVDVRTCEEQFGTCDPDAARQVSLGAMTSAKQIAEYVALTRLGFDATLVQGPAQVGSFGLDTCPEDAPPLRACNVMAIGDIITELEGTPITVVDDLTGLLDESAPGDLADISVERDGEPLDLQVELMEAPDEPERTIIGFMPRDTRTVEVPIIIEIDTDQIGGPSAGLSFTLSLIDLLSEGELTGGERVVATGTINELGEVGAIGALPQKAEAVRRAGATLFLVPSGQSPEDVERAQDIAGPGVEIVQVSTLEETLELLAERGGDPIPPPPSTDATED
jgi:PDZ domain-containing protein